jgi:hypothetical protein
MAVLRTREDAGEFVARDPFVLADMVARSDIRPWADILGKSRRLPAILSLEPLWEERLRGGCCCSCEVVASVSISAAETRLTRP